MIDFYFGFEKLDSGVVRKDKEHFSCCSYLDNQPSSVQIDDTQSTEFVFHSNLLVMHSPYFVEQRVSVLQELKDDLSRMNKS